MTASIHEFPKRITIKAYSVRHQVEISSQGRSLTARLIDISPKGARIAVARGKERLYVMGQAVGVNVRLTDKNVESGPIPSHVNWIQEGEIEVAFAHALNIGSSELQAAVG